MSQGRIVKKIFESKPERCRRRGSPRMRRLEDVEKNLREVKVKRWRQKAVDREERASTITESKALRRQLSRGVRKQVNKYDIF
jgi:hypothetical protein